ncbi:zinc transporter ZupT [Campylobacter jejuni]|uniref:Zinc transporter ZupT n=6 Tax=Campylobacter jejuni TaxID=197 RepID=ZUPT_CAMJE|nr:MULTISPECIES: zinc transporter ZupT [Campylobacter]YP_002343705.1 zinc transporter ZupT [Campylobacter jejuni subsp. jejuni NCTC 11168 = ATCC 700819]Q9PIN2.1 RecName: Full=Zinc transporter ZupT [Campylobacter jejuni subsp. jejuni NCTC 11168 = ATCC 700819]EAK5450290.1 zinc transporter ZupT [Campylobacter hyointestinalis]EFV11619.1 ZIP Zinc transporter family protein [Campylobacter jejuni subsp. jejuni 327]EIB18637.1 zinc transporter ZupT [Campylobacter jejuni subsp. jejuni LMG 23216]ETN9052
MQFTFEQIFIAMLLTLFAGFSTAIGSIIAFFSRKDDLRVLSLGLGFSAGVMIYISFMEILPTALKDFKNHYDSHWAELLGLACFFGGILISLLIDKLIPEDVNPHEPKEDLSELKICPLPQKGQNPPKFHPGEKLHQINTKALKRTGIFTALAIAIHNFPEGFATFISSLDNLTLGIAIAIAVAIHNIPEGLAVSLPIYHATGDKKKAFIYSALSGFAEPLGAFVGALILLPFIGDLTLAISFAVIAGIMVFISLDELLPAAKTYDKAHDSLYGLIAGMAIMALSLNLLGQ